MILNRQHVKVEFENSRVMVGKLTNTEGIPEAQAGCIVVTAESVADFIKIVQERFPTPQREGSSSRKKNYDYFDDGESSFNSFNSFEEAVEVFTKRPHEIRKFDEKDTNMRVMESTGNEISYDRTGDFLDIGRFLEGGPEVFGNMVMGNPRTIFADIKINFSCPAYVNADIINERSKRILRLVDWLESHGVRTTIEAIERTECGVHIIKVKQAHDPFDLDALAVVSHADFLRRIRFRATEWSDTYNSFYGRANEFPDKVSMEGSTLSLHIDYKTSMKNVEETMNEMEENVEKALSEYGVVFA